MKCPVCRHGETRAGRATVTLARGDSTLVFKDVPDEVCENRDEAFHSEQVTRAVLAQAEDAARGRRGGRAALCRCVSWIDSPGPSGRDLGSSPARGPASRSGQTERTSLHWCPDPSRRARQESMNHAINAVPYENCTETHARSDVRFNEVARAHGNGRTGRVASGNCGEPGRGEVALNQPAPLCVDQKRCVDGMGNRWPG